MGIVYRVDKECHTHSVLVDILELVYCLDFDANWRGNTFLKPSRDKNARQVYTVAGRDEKSLHNYVTPDLSYDPPTSTREIETKDEDDEWDEWYKQTYTSTYYVRMQQTIQRLVQSTRELWINPKPRNIRWKEGQRRARGRENKTNGNVLKEQVTAVFFRFPTPFNICVLRIYILNIRTYTFLLPTCYMLTRTKI